MGRAKLPRKSTNIDMTAMCDVAFLLLSFFILATKQKPPEVVPVVTPSSISTIKIEAKNKVLVTLSKDGKVFLSIDDKAKKKIVVSDLNTRFGLQLSEGDIDKLTASEIYGTPIGALKSFLALDPSKRTGAALPGIPAQDTANNELKDWMASTAAAFSNQPMTLLVKGDGLAKYPVFKNIIDAFKKNDLMKFSVITSQEGVDPKSDFFKEKLSGKKEE